MNDRIKFSDVSRLLNGLGYTLITVERSHHLFKHESGRAPILLPLSAARGVLPRDVNVIARIVDENGLLDRDEFDRRLHGDDGRGNGAAGGATRGVRNMLDRRDRER